MSEGKVQVKVPFFSSDITPPLIVQTQGIFTFGFDVSSQEIEYQGMTFIPHKDSMGHVIGLDIQGKAGTSVVKRTDDPAGLPRGLIRVYKLVIKNPGESNSYEYELIAAIDANGDGGFSRSLLAEEEGGKPLLKEGDRVLVTVEKGDIPLDQEFVLVFSEPLFVDVDIENIDTNEAWEPGHNLPISIKDVTDPGNSEEVLVRTRLLNSGTEVRIKPLNQLKENHVYELQTFVETPTDFPELMDCFGNPLRIQFNFRAKRSYSLYTEITHQEVYDTELIGSRLFVAAGYDGLRVVDVSNPTKMRTILTVPTLSTLNESQESTGSPLVFPDKVSGLSQWVEKEVVTDPITGEEKIIEHRWLVVVGGGNKNLGYIKLVNISELENPDNQTPKLYQYKSQIISDSYSDATTLPHGFPDRVEVFGNYAFISVICSGLVVVDLEHMETYSNRRNFKAIIRYHPENMINDVAVYRGLLKNPDIKDDPGKEEIIAAILVNLHGLKLLTLNRSEIEDPADPDKYNKYFMKEVGDYDIDINHHFTNLVLAEDYWVDIDEDGRAGIDEDNDSQIDKQTTGQNITAKDESRDVVFFAIPTLSRLVVVDVTEIYYKEDASGKRIDLGLWQPGWSLDFEYVRDAQDNYVANIRELELGREDRVLYVTDLNMGVMVVDAHLTGRKLFRKWENFMNKEETASGTNQIVKIADLFSGFYGVQEITNPESWYLGDINTSGKSKFGLLIDEDLNLAVVGQDSKGVDIIKLAQPEITFVKKEGNEYRFTEVRRMSPSGTREDELLDDNPLDYPDEVYIMALLPGGIAQNTDTPNKVYCDAWSLNSAHAYMIPWYNQNKVKTCMKKVELLRQSENPLDPWHKVFLSAPIRVTQDPFEDRKIDYRDREGNAKTSELRMLSGDIMWAHLGEDFLTDAEQQIYIDPFDSEKIGDKKPSIRAELIDRRENFDFKDTANLPQEVKKEKPNSPALNPAIYSNVLLHSGEFVWNDVDMRIPGRGFDFILQRTYRSQAIYSGPLGWGWDHNYNKRLLELYSGDVIYYDGTGLRERFKAVKNGDIITGYTAPKGWFVEFMKSNDGFFYLKYPDRTMESFDAAGRLISIRDRNQNEMEFFYNVTGQLSAVMDTMGRLIYFEYEPFETEVVNEDSIVKMKSCRLAEVRDFSGRRLQFEYYPNGDLKYAEFAGRKTEYIYNTEPNDIKKAHNLEHVKNPLGKTVISVSYIDDRVTSLWEGGIEAGPAISFAFSETSADVKDSKGYKKIFKLIGERIESIQENQQFTPVKFTYYEKDGLLETVTYPEGNMLTYKYDESGKRRSAGNLTTMTETPDINRGDNGSHMADTMFTYEPRNNQVETITYPNGLKLENREQDVNGNFRTVKALAPEYPEMAPLEYKYEFNEFGQLIEETGLFDMKTIYNYYSEGVPGGNTQTVSARELKSTGGYLKEIISPINKHNFVSYDERGNLGSYSNSMNVTGIYTSNDYDELETENVTSDESMSPLSYNAEYRHYQDGNLEWHKTTFSSGGVAVTRKTDYKYTPRNMVDYVNDTITTTPTDTKTITTDYGYDFNDNLTSISSGSDSISFEYNDRNLVDKVTSGSGDGASSVWYEYDGNGNVTRVIDPYGHETVFAYDGYDRLMQVKDPLNNVTLLTLFDKGNKLLIQHKDAENLLRESIRIDDPLGRLKSYEVKLPGGQSEFYRYTYTDGYKTITITDSLNRSWTYKKNEKGQVNYEEDPAVNFTNFYYEDAWGNMTKKEEHEKIPDGTEKVHVTKYKYNARNKIEEIRELMNEADPNQEDDEKDLITTFYYDTRGNLTGSKDAEGNIISHEYDGFNRKTLTKRYLKNGEEIKTFFTYYDNHLLKTIEDDKNNITLYEYDDQKRMKKITYPDLSYLEVTYAEKTVDEKRYKVVIVKQRNGTVVTNDYDKSGRLVSRSVQPTEGVEGTTFEKFDYDGLNRLTYAENNDFVVEFKFDPLNRITEEKQRDKLLNYTYSVVDNLRRMTMKYPNDRLIEKNFDLLDRLSNIKQGDNDIVLKDMKYIGRSYRLLNKQFGNNDVVNYLYDQGRRMTSKEAKNKNSDLINHYKYSYNKVHLKNYEQRMHENGIGDVFGYDAVSRLTNVKYNVPDPTAANPTDFERERNIFLDHLDNITRIDETKNGETTQITTEIPPETDYSKLNQYSRFDNWGLGYDKNGNLTQKSTQKMYFDYKNRMVRVTEGTAATENKYDALGRRLQKIFATGSQTKTENYYYSGHQIVEVRDGSDQVKRQFIYGNGIDEVIRMDVYSGSIATPYYLHINEIGSTTAVTDADGNVVERYKYGLYGMPAFMDAAGNVIPKSAIGNNILFQGREYEPETNFYYFRARHYDPIMGRFLQADPMGYEDSLNLYQALNMNPINFVDPFGTVNELGHGFVTKEDVEESYENRNRSNDAKEAVMFIYESTDAGDGISAMELALDINIETGKPLSKLEKWIMRAGFALPVISSRPVLKVFRNIFKTGEKIVEVGKKVIKNKATKKIFKSLKSGEVPFDPEKLERIQKSLEKQGVAFEVGEEAGKFARSRNSEAIYYPDVGKPGAIILDKNPSRTAVIEELLHLGQHRKLKWMNLSKEQIIRLEIEAQKKLLWIGEKLSWTLEEINRIKDALKIWESLLK